MSKKLIAVAALIVVTALALCGCSLLSLGNGSQDVYDRLDKLDEFKKTTQQMRAPTSDAQAYGAFRDVTYGYNRTDVMRIETLEVYEEFDNAIDFEYVDMFGYRMLPTYWFNANEQMYRGSYYMKTDDEITDIMSTLLPQLEYLFGSARETSYYNFNNEIVDLKDAMAIAAVDEGSAYFYAWYYYDVIDVEVYIEVQTPNEDVPIYEVYVNFTDYAYHD